MQTPDVFSASSDFTFSHLSYEGFLKDNKTILNFIKHGLSSSALYAKLRNPEYIHNLYHLKDPSYMSYLNEFYNRYRDYDVIVMNPGVDLVHPEFLYKYFPNAIKCLHFIDDPHLTYSYCLPFAWAFDCATYVSPSYSEDFNMEQILNLAGFKFTKWFPHCITNNLPNLYSENELSENLLVRENKIIYIGNYYTNKNKRLIKIKKHLGDKLDMYGMHPFKGLIFPITSTLSGHPSTYRVKKLTNKERENKYKKYAIGLNMHLSNPSRETGNARLYELAYRGVAQVVDSSKVSAVNKIFSPNSEILLYESTEECISQLNNLINDQYLRISIATAAYKRAIKEYSYENVINDTCNWFRKLKMTKVV